MKTTESRRGHRLSWMTAGMWVAACCVVVALAGCDWLDRALDVQAPELIPAEDMNDPDRAGLLVAGALADFDCALGSYIVIGGLLTDELIEAGALANRWPYDRRDVHPTDIRYATFTCQNLGVYIPVSTARFTTDDTLEKLESWSDDEVENRTSLIATMAAYSGYSHVLLGEGFCTAAIDMGPELTQEQVFELAEERFSRAISAAQASGDDDLLNMARVGRARVRLNLGLTAGAVEDAGLVTEGFAAFAPGSNTSSRRQNRVYIQNRLSDIVSVGPEFRDLDFGGVPDPRVEVLSTSRVGGDGITAIFDQTKFTSEASPIRIASWEEAQLILAEVEAESGDPQLAVDIINALHDQAGLPHFESEDPEEIQAQVQEERRRELFLESHRLYDVHRRGIELTPAAGEPYVKGGLYGTTTCLPLPEVERANNPNL